jgi:hypothetical protein
MPANFLLLVYLALPPVDGAWETNIAARAGFRIEQDSVAPAKCGNNTLPGQNALGKPGNTRGSEA